MGCEVTFHDHVGRDQLAAALEPMEIDQFSDLLAAAIDETVTAALGLRDCEVELTLCGDAEMERLNFDHMGERSPTDVLAFPLHEWSIDGRHSHLADDDGVSPPGATLLGDVVLNVDQGVRQASAGDWSVPRRSSCWRSTARCTCWGTIMPRWTRSRRCARWSTTCWPPSIGAIGKSAGSRAPSSTAPGTPSPPAADAGLSATDLSRREP